MTIKYGDTVQINHPEIEGTGEIVRFLNGNKNGVMVRIIKANRKSDGKVAVAGRKFACLQEYLTTIKERELRPLVITDDTEMAELFASEDAKQETIGVVTPEFTGRWK